MRDPVDAVQTGWPSATEPSRQVHFREPQHDRVRADDSARPIRTLGRIVLPHARRALGAAADDPLRPRREPPAEPLRRTAAAPFSYAIV